MSARDTIAAVATPSGAGGVAVVRLSGPAAAGIVARLMGRDEGSLPDRRVVWGVVREPLGGERVDEVLAVVMRAPRSYTGEDVAELHGHGGMVNVARLLGAVVASGARPATPGEFTRRAFENGRLDLTRAEAVAGIVGAASERALRIAQAQLAGSLGRRVEQLRAEAVALLAEVEASIDFPEEDLAFGSVTDVGAKAAALARATSRLAGSYALGRAMREGIDVALVGPPNVGKSSLLNALLGEERAVVTPLPGTTRDYLEARACWDGILVTLVDTAGQREVAESDAEVRGVALGMGRAARADVVLRVEDASRPSGALAGERELLVWNKIDLAPAPPGVLAVSALTGAGLADLRTAVLLRTVGEGEGEDEAEVVTTERQRHLLESAAIALQRAAAAASDGCSAELPCADLRAAVRDLASVTGESVDDRVLDAIFARFCIGK